MNLLTAEEFATRHGGDYAELIDGRVEPIVRAGMRNGVICGRVIGAFGHTVDDAETWLACSNDTFVLTRRNPDRVRGADFVLWRRELVPRPYPNLITVPPELVVEVRRPFDTMPEIIRKAVEYLDAKVRVVLVLDPDTKSAAVFRADELPQRFSNGDELALPDVLPGFSVPVRRFFE